MIKTALFTVTYCGLWYKGDAFSLKEQIIKAKELGFDGITIETKRPVALPCDLDRSMRKEVEELAHSYNIRIAAVETMSNFVSPIIEERENKSLYGERVYRSCSRPECKHSEGFCSLARYLQI